MVAESNPQAETAAEASEAPAKASPATDKAAAAAAKVEKNVKKSRKPAPRARRKVKVAARSRVKPAAKERNDPMQFDPTSMAASFGAFPGAFAFDKLFADAAERGETAVKRSRKAAEELADIYRGNVDALVEAGRIAAAGVQSIGQDFAAKSRDGIEQTANSVRAFAEAKSPTELLQLQSDFARTAFDRFVEDSSALTESVVKLAGEAFQPISNRASANVEKLNEIAA